MARPINLLSARAIPTLPTGYHKDGGNLFLRVRDTGSKSWVFRYKHIGTPKELGLGSYPTRSLLSAREIATLMRSDVVEGKDPALRLKQAQNPKAKTFKEYAGEYIENHKSEWRNAKHIQQWTNTLEQYAFSKIGNKYPKDISFADIKSILEPIWHSKTETATRLRGRIKCVLDYAAVTEGSDKRNPAAWEGNLDKVLAKPARVAKVKHHASADYFDLPNIMATLRKIDTVTAHCLRFLILTAARSGEARGALWEEISWDTKTWTLKANRMKANKDHTVPLCEEALEILKTLEKQKHLGGGFIFFGRTKGIISDTSLSKTLKEIHPNVTIHGFRSTFRVWGAETTSYPSQVLEFALAHGDPDKVQEAYQRSRLIERRRDLMATWGNFCKENTPQGGVVVNINKAA